VVIAGDDLQLPPILRAKYPDPPDGVPGLEDSIFAYLRARDRGPTHFTCQLLENWRMNASLSAFPAATLYGEGYTPATLELARRRLHLAEQNPADRHELCDWLLAPDYPMTICILENVQATAENRIEAELVARLAVDLRARLLLGDNAPLPPGADHDRRFWKDGLFVVSPHHVQIRAILRELAARRTWHSPPFVDTVDKMQGQQCEAVIASYGVSDPETALAEAEFIYSLNRLNVSTSRARSKCITFLPRPLLEPSFDLLSNLAASRGLGHMHALVTFCRAGQTREFHLTSPTGASVRLTAMRS
jgi:superfamily I DNA and/or RNA helicase